MALIRCKECGARVSELAQNCPTCGCPVIYSLAHQPAPKPVPQPVPQQPPASISQPIPQPKQQETEQPFKDNDSAPAPVAKKSRKGGKILGICGIFVGLALIAAGVFLMIGA